MFVDNGESREMVEAFVDAVVAEANTVYMNQLNIRLVVDELHIQDTAANPDGHIWNGCSPTIREQLYDFRVWTQTRERRGLWHLLTNCHPPPGVVGVAFLGVTCNLWWNTGVTSKTWSTTWKVFAHEVGHNFDAEHSFEEGQGQTGGIMDYGDGKLNGEYQFNTQYRKGEICATIDRVVSSCKHFSAFEAKCGNGIVEEGEECECENGTDCKCCSKCKLDSGAVCSPDAVGGSCCNSQCQFAPTTKTCTAPAGGDGYCSAGKCENPVCSSFGFDGFCGTHKDNDCKQSCLFDDTCNKLNGWVERGSNRPLNHVKDGSICRINGAAVGVCSSGSCTASGNPVTKSPTKRVTSSPTKRVTSSPTKRVTSSPTK